MGDLEFDDVVVQFAGGVRAVDGVSLRVPAGTVVGLVGESGSGKSTLARAAVGLAPVRSGTIRFAGEETRRRARRDRHSIQMIFQDPSSSLNPRMTVGNSIAESMATTPRAARRGAVSELLERVRLEPSLAAAYPADLSGGQKQRVSIARALAGGPRVVIADEITSALDVSVQGAVLNLLREVQQDLGLSMLFISHNLSVVRYVSDVIAVMYLGRIVEIGPAHELITQPQHPYTAALVAAATAVDTRRRTDPGGPLAALAAEGVEIEPPDPRHVSAGCRYQQRCALGPLLRDDRSACEHVDPVLMPLTGSHRVACHVTAPGAASGDATDQR